MQRILRIAVAAFMSLAGTQHYNIANAQTPPVKQIILSEKQVEGFIAAKKAISGGSNRQSSLASLVKQYGFADYAEFDNVETSIMMVMTTMDREGQSFTDPKAAIKKDMENVKKDGSMSPKQKTETLKDLNEQLKLAQTPHPGNVELVKKYYKRLEEVVQ